MSNEAVRFYPLDQWPGMADLPQTQDLTRQVTFPWSAPYRRRRNPVFDQRRRQSENQRSRDFESSYPRFPSIIGALIIAASTGVAKRDGNAAALLTAWPYGLRSSGALISQRARGPMCQGISQCGCV